MNRNFPSCKQWCVSIKKWVKNLRNMKFVPFLHSTKESLIQRSDNDAAPLFPYASDYKRFSEDSVVGNSTHENGENGQEELEVPMPGQDEHRLQFAYVLWFSHRPGGKMITMQPYDQNLKMVGVFSTVEQFWNLYGHIIRPSEMAIHSDFHLFKHGIKPMWEDEANKAGGKWIVRLKKGLASRCWEDLILAILGEQFMVGEEICGAVVSVRFQEDIISVWNKTASDQHTTIRIRDTLKRVLNLPPNTIMEYKTHNNSLRDKSSFRNTDVFLH